MTASDWMFGDGGLEKLRAPDSADPPKPLATAPEPTPAPAPKSELHQRVLEHTAKLRRALIEGAAQPAPPPAAAQPAPLPPPTSGLDDTAAIRRAIADKTQKTTLQALEKKGVKNVSILGLATIEKIVAEAVENALESRSKHMTGAARKQLEHEARREFFELLEEHKRAVSAKTDEERRRLELEKQVEKLRASLVEQEDALSEARERAGITIAPESLAELDARVRALLAEFMTAERRALLADQDEEKRARGLAGLAEIETKLGEVFDRLVGRLKSDYEELLELRIRKLNKALADTEDALRRVASMKMIDDGIASIYKTIQGLDLDAINFARKKELLAVVFLENLELQGKEITELDRKNAIVRSPITHTRAGELRTPADMDFQAPLDPITTETAF